MDLTIPSEQIQPEVPQNSKFSFIKSLKFWLLIILLALLIPTTGYFLSKNQATKQITTVQSSPTPDPTANWKTYANSKYGFSFKYPEGWKVHESPIFQVSGHDSFNLAVEAPQGIDFVTIYKNRVWGPTCIETENPSLYQVEMMGKSITVEKVRISKDSSCGGKDKEYALWAFFSIGNDKYMIDEPFKLRSSDQAFLEFIKSIISIQ